MTTTLLQPETGTERAAILAHLDGFIRQRPGLEYGNYCSGWQDADGRKAYFSEMRSITRDLHDARALLAAVAWRESITTEHLRESFRAYSGRLQWHAKGERCETCKGVGTIAGNWNDTAPRIPCYSCKGAQVNAKNGLTYCAGQYFPTEYRKAACAVLASALWGYFRANLADSFTEDHNGETRYTGSVKALRGMSYGDAIRATARRELSPRIARRWFN